MSSSPSGTVILPIPAPADIPADEEIIGEIRRTLIANRMRDGVHIRLTLTRGVKFTSGMDPRLNQAGSPLIALVGSS